MKRGSCGGSGTSTTLIGTGTHMQWSSGTGTKDSGTGNLRLLEYQCTFGARARSSFDPHFEITNEDCI